MKQPRGYLILLSLVFGAIFLTLLGALSSILISQNNLQNITQAQHQSLGVAETGLEYYLTEANKTYEETILDV